MTKYCDGEGKMLPCPRPQDCTVPCGDIVAGMRKIKPYPAVVPDDIEPVPEEWQTAGTVVIFCILGVLAFICLAIFFTGVWVWSLLI